MRPQLLHIREKHLKVCPLDLYVSPLVSIILGFPAYRLHARVRDGHRTYSILFAPFRMPHFKPQRALPKKMETPLSKAPWYVRLCRTTAVSACNACTKHMETPRCEAPSHARFSIITEASVETHTFDVQMRFTFFVGTLFFARGHTRKQYFRLGTRRRCNFRFCKMAEASSETHTFDVQL